MGWLTGGSTTLAALDRFDGLDRMAGLDTLAARAALGREKE